MQPSAERRNPQAIFSFLERFGKIMSDPIERAEILGIFMQLAFKVRATAPVPRQNSFKEE